MPVECNIGFARMSQDEFHSLDKRIMRHVFDIHNTMGRFFRHTSIRRMHWINLNHRNITLQTLKNDSVVK
jgi:hypothetical protein